MITYVASKNAGKLRELTAMFAGSALDAAAYPGYVDVVEDAGTYAGNALLKAGALRAQLERAGIAAAVLADDSGLEVDALGGRPGVLSARFGGAGATWPQRRALLLRELDGVARSQRRARFVCVMALIVPSSEAIFGSGQVEGCIAERESGSGGFGYDPLFFYPPLGRTFAELPPHEKDAVSHRRRAAQAVLAALAQRV